MKELVLLALFLPLTLKAQEFINSDLNGNQQSPFSGQFQGQNLPGLGAFSMPNMQEGNAFGNPTSHRVPRYTTVKPTGQCPLLTQSSPYEKDIFNDLRIMLEGAARRPNCHLGGNNNSTSISQLEKILSSSNSSVPQYTPDTTSGINCYQKNVELIGDRNLALFQIERGITPNTMGSKYSDCFMNFSADAETKKRCVTTAYENALLENDLICKDKIIPQKVQQEINQGLIGLEKILTSAMAAGDDCQLKSQDVFKTAMNTFVKVKALSVVGPWGAAASFGADLVSGFLDKLFPSDSQKSSELLQEILGEETFEQNACLFYNIQQKLYCEERPAQVVVATDCQSCARTDATPEISKLIKSIEGMKRPVETISSTSSFNQPQSTTSEVGAELLGAIDSLVPQINSVQKEIESRIDALPKMQRAQERSKFNNLMGAIEEYKKYDPETDKDGKISSAIIQKMSTLLLGDTQTRPLDLKKLILSTTPGTNLEKVKQMEIALSVERAMVQLNQGTERAENSRIMAKFDRYKRAMATVARDRFESRLNKQFSELQSKLTYVSTKNNGKINDAASEGQLRTIVRHCTFLQDVYDPELNGKMPAACERLTCGKENRLHWFKPSSQSENITQYQKQYCEKSINYRDIEDLYIKELKEKSSICGVNVEKFF